MVSQSLSQSCLGLSICRDTERAWQELHLMLLNTKVAQRKTCETSAGWRGADGWRDAACSGVERGAPPSHEHSLGQL